MVNIKRRFADDDPSSDEDGIREQEPQYQGRAGGKQLNRMMGKQLRPPPPQSESDDDDDDDEEEEEEEDEEEEEAVENYQKSSSGKGFRPGSGKQLNAHDAESDEDSDVMPIPIRPVQRTGGKALMRPPSPDEDFDSDDSDPDEDDPEEEAAAIRPVQRGLGGKSLMRPPDDSDENDEVDDDDLPPAAVIPVARGGGKAFLRNPMPEENEENDDSNPVIPVQLSGSNALVRSPVPDDSEQEESAKPDQHSGEGEDLKRSDNNSALPPAKAASGKQLRKNKKDDDDDDDDEEEEEIESELDDDDDDDDEMDIDSDSDEEEPVARTAPAQGVGKVLRSAGKRLRKALSDDDDDDDKEIVPSKRPTRSAAAAAASKMVEPDDMEESDEESSEEEMDDGALDPQSLIKDDEDQKYLDSLPEIEREAILGERFEKRKAELDMKQALKEAKRKEREDRKAVAGSKVTRSKKPPVKVSAQKSNTSKDEEISASLAAAITSGRNRDASGAKNKKAQALAVLRQQRKVALLESKKDEDEESDLDFGDDDDSDDDYEAAEGFLNKLKQKKTRSSTVASASLSKSDRHKGSDDESDDGNKPLTGHRNPQRGFSGAVLAVEATLDDYIQISLPRRRLARWCHEPYFNEAVIGCFARVFIGPDKSTGEKMYRLCEIVNVTKGKKEYKFPSVPNEKPVSSNKILHLRFGTNTREFPMYLISDSRPNEEDVNKFVTMEKTNRQDVMSRNKANRIRKHQDSLVNNYTYTKEDIELNLQEGKKGGKALSNLALEQTRAGIAVQGAETQLKEARRKLDEAKKKLLEYNDGDRIDESYLESAVKIAEQGLGEAEEELEGKAKAQQILNDMVTGRKSKLNQRRNDQNWAKVNQRALKMNKDADFEAYKAQKAQEENEATHGVAKFNPYARRKAKPKILWEVGQKEEKKDDEPSESKENDKRDEIQAKMRADSAKVAQTLQEAQKAAQITQSHQFAFDEEDTRALSFNLKSKKHKVPRVRKGLSLTDYLARKTVDIL